MNRIHIVGRKNHGKTTLIVELVREFCRRGIRVGTIKHSRHVHELDTTGKDSHRHRAAGSQPAAIVTKDLVGIYLSRDGASDYQRMGEVFVDCQIVLVEGDIEAHGVKVEAWRSAVGSPCLAGERTDITAVVSDDRPDPDVAVPVWPRSDVVCLADRMWCLADGNWKGSRRGQ